MSCCPPATLLNEQRRRAGMRVMGLDIHRAFAEAVAWDDGKLKRLGRVDLRRHLLEAFAMKLSKEDVVVFEATGNAASVAEVIAPHVRRVVIANPKQVRVIADAKIKTNTIDAGVLAQLYASGFLPEADPFGVACGGRQGDRAGHPRKLEISFQKGRGAITQDRYFAVGFFLLELAGFSAGFPAGSAGFGLPALAGFCAFGSVVVFLPAVASAVFFAPERAGFSAAGSAGGLALASLLWALSASYSATASCQCESDRPSGRPSCTHKWCAISRMRFSRSVIGPPPMSAHAVPRFASGSRQPSSPLPIGLPAVAPPQRLRRCGHPYARPDGPSTSLARSRRPSCCRRRPC